MGCARFVKATAGCVASWWFKPTQDGLEAVIVALQRIISWLRLGKLQAILVMWVASAMGLRHGSLVAWAWPGQFFMQWSRPQVGKAGLGCLIIWCDDLVWKILNWAVEGMANWSYVCNWVVLCWWAVCAIWMVLDKLGGGIGVGQAIYVMVHWRRFNAAQVAWAA